MTPNDMRKMFDEELSTDTLRKLLDELREDWAERPVELIQLASGWRFRTRAEYLPFLERLNPEKPPKYSRAVLETLAIIAYRQPVTRAEIEGVRGVAVDHILRLLMELQLVKIAGRSELPGKPLLYGTTSAFLEHFGLKEIKDLPGIQELARRNQEAASAAEAPVESEATTPDESTVEPVALPAESPSEVLAEPVPETEQAMPADEEAPTP